MKTQTPYRQMLPKKGLLVDNPNEHEFEVAACPPVRNFELVRTCAASWGPVID